MDNSRVNAGQAAVQTANVTLYGKYDVVLLRRATWEGLSSAQREALRDSVSGAVSDAMSNRPTELQGQASWCLTTGAATVLASAPDLASLHARLDPVTEALSEDPANADVIERMRSDIGVEVLRILPPRRVRGTGLSAEWVGVRADGGAVVLNDAGSGCRLGLPW